MCQDLRKLGAVEEIPAGARSRMPQKSPLEPVEECRRNPRWRPLKNAADNTYLIYAVEEIPLEMLTKLA